MMDFAESDALPEQREAYQVLCKKLSDFKASLDPPFSEREKVLFDSPVMIWRYLRKGDYDADTGYRILLDNFTWRREFQDVGVENIHEEDILTELKVGKSFPHKYDREGRPIVYCRPGLHFGNQCDREELHRWGVWAMDMIMTDLMPKGVDECIMIFDLGSFGLANMDYDFVKFIISLFDTRYPRSLHQVFIVNSPWLFYGCWALIKPWIDPDFVERISFVNLEDLKKYIAPENLLSELGGSDPYEFKHMSPEEREGTNFQPYWEMEWVHKRFSDEHRSKDTNADEDHVKTVESDQ